MTSRALEALASAQRDLAGLISALDGTSTAPADLEGWLCGDRAIPPQERVRVYANAYFARIHDALRKDYGALHAVLGADGFHDLAKLYLIAHPSRSFSLRFVGARLPAFLAGPIGEPFERRWPFAADLASLEWAITDVFDAPDAPALSHEVLAAVPAEAWERLCFELGAAQQLLQLGWPVHRTREAWESDLPLPQLEPATTRVLVYRRGEHVLHREVSEVEADALECVQQGRGFGAVCARIAELTGEAQGPPRALEILERWIADGLLSGLTT